MRSELRARKDVFCVNSGLVKHRDRTCGPKRGCTEVVVRSGW